MEKTLEKYSDKWAEAQFPYGGPVFGDEEIANMIISLRSGRFWDGPYVKAFEEDLADYLGVKNAIFCNSGSSALLLAMTALKLPRGSMVATQALAFPTTVNVIVQNGLKPVFVDVELETLNVHPRFVLEAVECFEARAYMHTHTIGNCPDMDKLGELRVPFIEDFCDSLGSSFNGKRLGTFGIMGCTSFHPAHQICTMLGGAVVTDSDEYADTVRMLRDWGRISQRGIGERFQEPYDMRYYYPERGYNMQGLEVSAAMGVIQLRRLSEFNEIRMRNFESLRRFFSKHEDVFILPKTHPKAKISWFGYPVIIREESGLKKFDLMRKFEDVGIQTRSIYGGTIIRQPCYKDVKYEAYGDLDNSDYLSKNAFWIGCYQGLSEAKIKEMCERIQQILS